MTDQPIATYAVDTSDADQTRALGEDLGRVLVAGDLVMLSGGLGAGKTTLTQGIGVGMGVAFGWVGVMSLPIEGATPVLSVPWLQLVGVCVVAIVSALIASWLPGRRAAKVSPSEALATE